MALVNRPFVDQNAGPAVALGVPAFLFELRSELRAQGEHETEFPPKEGRGLKIVEASYSARSTTYCSDQALSLDVFTALPLGSAGGLLVHEKLGMIVVGRGLLAFTATLRRGRCIKLFRRAEWRRKLKFFMLE
ncbi:hypothetical protein [Amycolatopsis sp. NPDC004169]|uniref:hypothetical protein n=1 Tax=Amycolatopsis sp. NPDC004169 TaxID=3154453 RepID=UPI0033B69E14